MTPWLPWLLIGLVTASSQGLPADLEPASLMTTPVLLMNGTRAVSQGTGFFFASTTLDGKPDTVFLVTNYHVVTGRPPLTPGPRAGDHIRFILHENPAELTRVRQIELPLYDQRGDPLWVVSEAVPKADVVLVPVPPEAYSDISLLVFTEAHTRGDIRIRPSSGATLLGYPYGFYDESHFLPVWKTGHVASEPSVDFNDLPTFLVDVSAFPGMSGSPVLAVANGIYESEDGTMRSGRVLKLLGIFSAMPVVREKKPADVNGLAETQTTEINLQLGYVWKAALIADVAKTYRPRR
jgi:hypothetical protein